MIDHSCCSVAEIEFTGAHGSNIIACGIHQIVYSLTAVDIRSGSTLQIVACIGQQYRSALILVMIFQRGHLTVYINITLQVSGGNDDSLSVIRSCGRNTGNHDGKDHCDNQQKGQSFFHFHILPFQKSLYV